MRPSTLLTFALAASATAQTNIISEDLALTTIIDALPATTDSATATTSPTTNIVSSSVEPTGILVDTGVPEIPGATSVAIAFASSTITNSAVGSVGTGVAGIGSNKTSSHGERPSSTSAPFSGGQRVKAFGGVLGFVVGAMMAMI